MYDANVSFATNFAALITATNIHKNSSDFSVRVTAREAMTVAERKIENAKRHYTFCLQTAMQTAILLKKAA